MTNAPQPLTRWPNPAREALLSFLLDGPVIGNWSFQQKCALSGGSEGAHYVGKNTAAAKSVICISSREYFRKTELLRFSGVAGLGVDVATGESRIAPCIGA